MKYVSYQPITVTNPQDSVNSAAIDASQLYRLSAHVITGAGTINGTVQLQVSNDPITVDYLMSQAPTNWSNLGSAVTLTQGTASLVTEIEMCYRSLRVQYLSATTLQSTITAVADTGALEVSSVTAVADVSNSLQSKYFTFTAVSSAGVSTNYYVWYNVSGGGTNPSIAGKTGIAVAISTNATAATVASTTQTAITAAAGSLVTVGSGNPFTITDKFLGNVTNIADGTAATGFTLSTTTQGASSNLNNKYFTIASGTTSYYAWFNVNSQGTDPAISGRTAVPIAIAAGATANTVAGAIRTAFTALSDFSTSGATNQAIMASLSAGVGQVAVDGTAATGFTFASNAPTSSVTVNLFAIAV